MQGWSGTPETYDGSDARKRLHGGRSVRGEGDGYRNEMSGAAFAMEFHASKCPAMETPSFQSRLNHLPPCTLSTVRSPWLINAVYGAWLHPELQKKAWGTILNKGEIYNNCK